MHNTAIFYDGTSAIQHPVILTMHGETLEITSVTRDKSLMMPIFRHKWRYKDMKLISNPHDGVPMRLSYLTQPQTRLQIDAQPMWDELYARLLKHKTRAFYVPAHMGIVAGLLALSLMLMIGL